MLRIACVLCCAVLAAACATEAPESPAEVATEPMLEVRVYFEGLVAFAPDPDEPTNWVAVLAEALPSGPPHVSDVRFGGNVAPVNPATPLKQVIRDQQLSFAFASSATQALAFTGPLRDQMGATPMNPEEARSFYWTAIMPPGRPIPGSNLKANWRTLSAVKAGVVLDDGTLETAALAAAVCEDPPQTGKTSMALVGFTAQNTGHLTAQSELVVLIIRKKLSALEGGQPVVTLTTTPLPGRPPVQSPALSIKAKNPDADGNYVISVRILNSPQPNAETPRCERGEFRQDGPHFDAFRQLAKSSRVTPTFPNIHGNFDGWQPNIYAEYSAATWTAAFITFPPLCPPTNFQ